MALIVSEIMEIPATYAATGEPASIDLVLNLDSVPAIYLDGYAVRKIQWADLAEAAKWILEKYEILGANGSPTE